MFRQRGATVDFQGDIKAFSAFRFPADSLKALPLTKSTASPPGFRSRTIRSPRASSGTVKRPNIQA